MRLLTGFMVNFRMIHSLTFCSFRVDWESGPNGQIVVFEDIRVTDI